ncbi:transmembrane protein [Bat paramyxovirus]|uniref:Transmembrane protein n=1 Tax=bat paramyxovirus 17770 TaxID=3070195 RepID=A0AA48JU20_9MONO|nr:transmembrane protein [Bat paramyxovirus]AYM47543.1 transmembrane protein [bat paramyxovirus 17770]
MSHIHDYILLDLKPRSIVMDRILSYQLPTAIVKAFEVSHTDLRETLEGVVVDLAKLTEVYRALLGFDENWDLESNAQRLKCSWSPITIAGERVLGTEGLSEYELRANQSIEHIKSLYGDFDNVKANIQQLFDQILIYFANESYINGTEIRNDYYYNMTMKNLTHIFEDHESKTVVKFMNLIKRNVKYKNKIIDQMVQKAIQHNVSKKSNKSHSRNNKKKRQSKGRKNRTPRSSLELQEDINHGKRSSGIVESPDMRAANPTLKKSNQHFRSDSSEVLYSQALTREAQDMPAKKLKLSWKDIKDLTNENSLMFRPIKPRFDPLYTHPDLNQTVVLERLKIIHRLLSLNTTNLHDKSFYDILLQERPRTIKDKVKKKLGRMKRFTFIPNLAAYRLPLYDHQSSKKKIDQASTSKTKLSLSTPSPGLYPELKNRLEELSARTMSLLRGNKSLDLDQPLFDHCYVGKIPGYKLIYCPQGGRFKK